jgi:hypothetical protein
MKVIRDALILALLLTFFVITMSAVSSVWMAIKPWACSK